LISEQYSPGVSHQTTKKCKFYGVELIKEDEKHTTKHDCFTLNFEKSISEAILQASFLFWPVAEAVSHTLFPLALASTKNILVSFNGTDRNSNSKL